MMKNTIKKLDGTAREFVLEAPKERIEKVLADVLEEIRKDAKIPGFRPGKAPMDIIQKSYHSSAMEEVKRRLIPELYQEALEEHDINPVSFPEFSEVDISASGNLVFKAKVDVHPEVNIAKYKGIKVITKKINTTDSEVEDGLKRIRDIYAEFSNVTRPIQKGDFAICNVEIVSNGSTIAKKREGLWIEASKNASMFGIGEELCGLNAGDKKDIAFTLPQDYTDKNYAGKPITFRVEVKEVREKKLPEINEEFIKKLGKNTIDEVRQELKTEILAKKKDDADKDMKKQIMLKLLETHPMALPMSLVKRQLKVLLEKAENELVKKGLDAKTIEANREKLRSELSKEAEDKVRLYFLLGEIANRENIDISNDEMDERLKEIAAFYNEGFEKLKKYYEEHDLMEGLKENMREDKTLDFLVKEAIISE